MPADRVVCAGKAPVFVAGRTTEPVQADMTKAGPTVLEHRADRPVPLERGGCYQLWTAHMTPPEFRHPG